MLDNIKKVLQSELDVALKEQEIPVAALIVFNNEILCSAHNQRVANNDVTAHAEVLVIKEAARILGDWRLNGCSLYVTLEPCAMCKEIIKESRIDNVYYCLKRNEEKRGFYKTNFILSDNFLTESFQQNLSHFFKDNCNR